MSKGSSPRPYSVSQQQFAANWDAIFNTGKSIDKEILADLELEKYKSQAQELWSDSCTTGRSE